MVMLIEISDEDLGEITKIVKKYDESEKAEYIKLLNQLMTERFNLKGDAANSELYLQNLNQRSGDFKSLVDADKENDQKEIKSLLEHVKHITPELNSKNTPLIDKLIKKNEQKKTSTDGEAIADDIKPKWYQEFANFILPDKLKAILPNTIMRFFGVKNTEPSLNSSQPKVENIGVTKTNYDPLLDEQGTEKTVSGHKISEFVHEFRKNPPPSNSAIPTVVIPGTTLTQGVKVKGEKVIINEAEKPPIAPTGKNIPLINRK